MRRAFLRTITSAALGAGALAVATGASSFLAACVGTDEDGDSTTGKRVTLATRAELRSGPSFTNALGWSFTLTKVQISSGALYYFDGEPLEPVARAPARPPVGSLLLGVAHAHPGHYKEGNAKGEMLEAASYDLVAGAATLGTGEGVSGLFRSARFTYQSPAAGALASEMGAAVVIVEGSATKDGVTRAFRLVGLADDVLDAEGEPVLDGCVFEEIDVEDDGTVTVGIDPSVWLDQADLSGLPEGSVPVEVAREDVVHLAFARGLKKSTACHFSFS